MKKSLLTAILATAWFAMPAKAETTECTNITALPITISVQGVYCFKQHLGTAITSGNAITIATNNVTIDFNGFKLGGLAAGPATNATGIYADNRQNITLRNGNIRGFKTGAKLIGSSTFGISIENSTFDGNLREAIDVSGTAIQIQGNRIVNTGGHSVNGDAVAIRLSDVSDSIIMNNLISGVAPITTNNSRGIHSINSLKRVTVLNNDLFNIGSETSSAAPLSFGVASIGNIIENNRISLDSAASGSYMIYFGSTSDNNICRGNSVVGGTVLQFNCEVNVDNQHLN